MGFLNLIFKAAGAIKEDKEMIQAEFEDSSDEELMKAHADSRDGSFGRSLAIGDLLSKRGYYIEDGKWYKR